MCAELTALNNAKCSDSAKASHDGVGRACREVGFLSYGDLWGARYPSTATVNAYHEEVGGLIEIEAGIDCFYTLGVTEPKCQ